MHELTIEAISLVGHRVLRNPASHRDLASGQMNQDQAAQHKLDATFYKNLLVSHSMPLAATIKCLQPTVINAACCRNLAFLLCI